MKNNKCVKVVMLPWLAMGHLTPFLELSKSIAKKGIQVYLVTTPNNIARLPKLPSNLMAATMGISCAYVALFNAATLSFLGPPSALLGNERSSLDKYTVVPNWIPFESDITYRPYEVVSMKHFVDARVSVSDVMRFGKSIQGCDFVGVRSSPELEPIWINLLERLYGKLVLPFGFLFPDLKCGDDWLGGVFFKEWLDKQKPGSVLYVAFGSQCSLTKEQVYELGLGLENSGVPFVLILRDPPGSDKNAFDMLPEGFVDRVAGRGLVHQGWAPQVEILRHPATGGFLSHCGWNSVIEGLGLGRVLVLFPLMSDQGLVARFLAGQGLGVEIERDQKDGSMKMESVVKAVRLAMVEKEGEELRMRCKSMVNVFGNNKLNDEYIGTFVSHLEEHKKLK